jgi:transcriptional regulator with XRE-family HTH domain
MRIPLKLALLHSGRTQIDLSKATQIAESRLSRIFHGHSDPTPSERQRLATSLGVGERDVFPEVEADTASPT